MGIARTFWGREEVAISEGEPVSKLVKYVVITHRREKAEAPVRDFTCIWYNFHAYSNLNLVLLVQILW